MKKRTFITVIIAIAIGTILTGCLTTGIETVHSQTHHYEFDSSFEKIDTCTTKAFLTGNDAVISVYFWWRDKTNEKFVFTYNDAGKMKCLDLSQEWSNLGEKNSKSAYRDICYATWKEKCSLQTYNSNYGIITYYGTFENKGE